MPYRMEVVRQPVLDAQRPQDVGGLQAGARARWTHGDVLEAHDEALVNGKKRNAVIMTVVIMAHQLP